MNEKELRIILLHEAAGEGYGDGYDRNPLILKDGEFREFICRTVRWISKYPGYGAVKAMDLDAIAEDPEFYSAYCNAYNKGGHDYYNLEMKA